MKKRDFLEMMNAIGDDEEVQFETIVESGRGYVGDFDGRVRVFFNDDDNNWRIRVSGDEESESGYWE